MRLIRLAITAICLILSPHIIVASSAWEPIVPFGIIKGVIRDSSLQPIPYANVMVEGHKLGAMSDSQGSFSIYFVPPGMYTVRSMMIGYKPAWARRVTVHMGRETEIKVEMKEEPNFNKQWIEGRRAP